MAKELIQTDHISSLRVFLELCCEMEVHWNEYIHQLLAARLLGKEESKSLVGCPSRGGS